MTKRGSPLSGRPAKIVRLHPNANTACLVAVSGFHQSRFTGARRALGLPSPGSRITASDVAMGLWLRHPEWTDEQMHGLFTGVSMKLIQEARRRAGLTPIRVAPNAGSALTKTGKLCARCKRDLPLSEFGMRKRKDYRVERPQPYCKTCTRAVIRAAQAKRPEHYRVLAARHAAKYAAERKAERVRTQAERVRTQGCRECGGEFTTTHPQKVFCSDRCGERSRRQSSWLPTEQLCTECGVVFCQRSPNQMFCSRACQKRSERRNRRHAKRAKVAGGDAISLKRLGERDGWRCWICHRRVSNAPHPGGFQKMGPSIDHVVPLSQGGPHSWENVRLAHHGCNSRRGAARDEAIQLRLVG